MKQQSLTARKRIRKPQSTHSANTVYQQTCIKSLHGYQGNARKHSNEQIEKIADSIKAFGFNNPILIDNNHTVIAGHARLEAAKKLGLSTVPTLLISHLTDHEKKAYIIADNRLAELATWDTPLLAQEFESLVQLDSDITVDFDITITGFETGEIDHLLFTEDSTSDDVESVELPNDTTTAISRLGDLWQLDQHRLYCGDALNPDDYQCLMANDKATLVFTDPPYNVKVNGHVGGLGKTQHREFAMASGEMSEQEFQQFLQRCIHTFKPHCDKGALAYLCMDWRHLGDLFDAAKAEGLSLLNLCVWNKSNGGMGSFYRSKHEMIPQFKVDQHSHINNVQLGKHGRYRTNVWDYPGVNTFRNGRDDELAMHPTVKPTPLVMDVIQDASHHGNIVLDCFGGSGTTLIAAEKTQRQARIMELDPLYVDTIIRRWEILTGEQAIHHKTSLSLADIGQKRSQEANHEL